MRSLQACADHILAFFRAGGTYNAIDAAHSELPSNEVTTAEYEEYMSAYPPGTVLVREYSKLQGHSGAFNSKSPEVRAIRNKLRGQSSKLPIKLLSITALNLKVDKGIIEEEEENMEDDKTDTMSIAESTANSFKNTRKNANKKLRKAKLKAAGGDGVPTDARSPAAHAASSSGRSCYHNDDDAASSNPWQKIDL